MLPYSISNHLTPSRKMIIGTKSQQNSNKKNSKQKYYFEGLMRKHSMQQKNNKICKSYSVSKNNKTKNMNMIIPSFQLYQSRNHQKITFKGALSNIDKQQQTQQTQNQFFPASKNQQDDKKYDLNITTRISKTSQKNRFFGSNKNKRNSQMYNAYNMKNEILSNNQELPSLSSQILPITYKKSQQSNQSKRKSYSKQIILKKSSNILESKYMAKTFRQNTNQTAIKNTQSNFQMILYQKYSKDFYKFIELWCSRNQIPGNSKIFAFNSSDLWLKEALLRRGWTHNPEPETLAYHFKWSTKIENPKKKKYQEQIHNHFYQSDLITSKSQFAQNTRKSLKLRKMIPRSYDLGSQSQAFAQNFKQTAILCGFKKIFSVLKSPTIGNININPHQILKSCEYMLETKDYIDNSRQNDNTQIIHIPYAVQMCAFTLNIICKMQGINIKQFYILSSKTIEKLTEFSQLQPSYNKFMKRKLVNMNSAQQQLKLQQQISFSTETINLYTAKNSFGTPSNKLKNIIIAIHTYLCQKLNTYQQQGTQNLWIIKTRNSSKGVGIHLSNQFYQICLKKQNRLVQKYIQNCLLYCCNQKKQVFKFDLRVWVLVNSFCPLIAYYYPYYYGRLCSEPYNLQQYDNLTSHLTNYQLNKKKFIKNSKNQSILTTEQIQQIIYQKYCQKNQIKPEQQVKNNFIQSFSHKLEQLIIQTLKQYENTIQKNDKQHNNFQLYGFDVLISDNLGLFLLQVNLSPACDANRNQWLQNNVQEMADGLLDIIVKNIDQIANKQDNKWKLLKQYA